MQQHPFGMVGPDRDRRGSWAIAVQTEVELVAAPGQGKRLVVTDLGVTCPAGAAASVDQFYHTDVNSYTNVLMASDLGGASSVEPGRDYRQFGQYKLLPENTALKFIKSGAGTHQVSYGVFVDKA